MNKRRGGGNNKSGHQDPKESRDDKIQFEGVVFEALPNAMFKVETDTGMLILATISGKMRKFSIRILVGDHVTVEVSPYDPTRGRIMFRHK